MTLPSHMRSFGPTKTLYKGFRCVIGLKQMRMSALQSRHSSIPAIFFGIFSLEQRIKSFAILLRSIVWDFGLTYRDFFSNKEAPFSKSNHCPPVKAGILYEVFAEI